MIRYTIKRTCEAILLAALIVGILFATISIAPVFQFQGVGGVGVDSGVVTYQFKIQKTPLLRQPVGRGVQPRGTNDG